MELAERWGEVDRSHRKPAHRGSYVEVVWVSPSTVRRVLTAHRLVLPDPGPRESVGDTFAAMLRANGFYDVHLTHGTAEHGKDFIAKRVEDGAVRDPDESRRHWGRFLS